MFNFVQCHLDCLDATETQIFRKKYFSFSKLKTRLEVYSVPTAEVITPELNNKIVSFNFFFRNFERLKYHAHNIQ